MAPLGRRQDPIIFHEVVRGRSIVGGAAALGTALQSAAKAAGIEIRTEAPVAGLAVTDHHVDAVRLADGEEISTDMVVACCDPKQALLDFVNDGDGMNP